jgi:hypothetical protein
VARRIKAEDEAHALRSKLVRVEEELARLKSPCASASAGLPIAAM